MLPFWVSVIIRHLLFRVYPKRDLNFDNYPFEGFRVLACGPTCGFRGALGYRVQACRGFGLGFRARLEIQGSRGSGLTAPACSEKFRHSLSIAAFAYANFVRGIGYGGLSLKWIGLQ